MESGMGLLTCRVLLVSDPGGGSWDLPPSSLADVSGSAGQAVLLGAERSELRWNISEMT